MIDAKVQSELCDRSHRFHKDSSCPVCPYCWSEQVKNPGSDLPKTLAAPAVRALSSIGVTHISQVARFTEPELRRLHGIGPNSMKSLRAALKSRRLAFSGSRRSQ